MALLIRTIEPPTAVEMKQRQAGQLVEHVCCADIYRHIQTNPWRNLKSMRHPINSSITHKFCNEVTLKYMSMTSEHMSSDTTAWKYSGAVTEHNILIIFQPQNSMDKQLHSDAK